MTIANIFRKHVMVYVMAIFLVKCTIGSPVDGAITDSELSRISQLIQEGRTDRARAEIMILLDENPNDPRSPQLRRILQSIKATESAEDKPLNPSAPSIKVTLRWLGANLSAFSLSYNCFVGEDYRTHEFGVVRIDVRDANLIIVMTRNMDVMLAYHPLSNTKSFNSFHQQVLTIPLAHALLLDIGYEAIERQGACSLREIARLRIRTSSGSIRGIQTHYHGTESRTGGWSHRFDEDPTVISGRLRDPQQELARRLSKGIGRQFQESEFILRLAEGAKHDAERIKNAVDHLIKLHGGGQTEPF